MKLQVEPTHLIDINRLPLDKIEETPEEGRIGATVNNWRPTSVRLLRGLSRALLSVASALRNNDDRRQLAAANAALGYDVTKPCNKRRPGSGCASFNRHAILSASTTGASPSTARPWLSRWGRSTPGRTVDAKIHIFAIPIDQFHRLPLRRDDVEAGDVITAVTCRRRHKAKRIYRKSATGRPRMLSPWFRSRRRGHSRQKKSFGTSPSAASRPNAGGLRRRGAPHPLRRANVRFCRIRRPRRSPHGGNDRPLTRQALPRRSDRGEESDLRR